jgi:DNA-binding transcriptional LysR family regulator
VELRDIEIFLTLARELHFGRAAERLHITRSRVSKSIVKQERRIGAPLFERTSRRVTLTTIGARLRDDLESGYRRILDAIESAAAAARGVHGTLTFGILGHTAHLLAAASELFASRHPGCELVYREATYGDPCGPLRSGEVDLQLCWLPVDEPGLSVGPVTLVMDIHLMAAASHPLAHQETVSLEDLGDCVVPQSRERVPAGWEEALIPSHTPSGRPIARGPKAATLEEILAVVATGRVVCPLHSGLATGFLRPGIAFIPFRDAPPGRFALVWRTACENPLIRAYLQAATDSFAARVTVL